MRAVVTGGAGFIGSALARRLVGDGHQVVVVDDLSTGDREAIAEDARFVSADVSRADQLEGAFEGADVVFHQAALGSVVKSLENPRATHDANATGTLNVLIEAERAGVARVVYASSSSVYGDTGGARNHEDMAPNPPSPYAVSKLAGEHYCRAWSALGRLSTVSLRYFNVFGPGQPERSRYSAVFPAFITALANGRPPVVHGDGEQSRAFTYIDDVVEANILAAQASTDADGQTVNIASAETHSVNEVLAAVADALGRWIEPERGESRPGDIRVSRADISRAARLLGWSPRAEWTAAVAATVAAFAGAAGRPQAARS